MILKTAIATNGALDSGTTIRHKVPNRLHPSIFAASNKSWGKILMCCLKKNIEKILTVQDAVDYIKDLGIQDA